VQRVHVKLNPVPEKLDEGFHLIEITVPFAQSFLQRKPGEWTPIYRLYFGTVHWAVGIVEGPDGEPWYRIVDELIRNENLHYYIPANQARLVTPEETTPISPDVNPDKKYIEVSLAQQELTAYEEGRVVLKTKISSGLNYQPPDEIPWNTPTGRFHVQTKMPSKHMGGAELTDDIEAYVLPGVPWVSFFEPENGIAFHGTYWHQNYGMPMSHGCINMKIEEARWLYRWVTPVGDMSKITTVGYGTQVHVF
jgi:lipoprotein-anchoring transpeptidase ErfK/SrfK